MKGLTVYFLFFCSILWANHCLATTGSKTPRVIDQSLDEVIAEYGEQQSTHSAEILYKFRTIGVNSDYLDTTTTYVAIRINESKAISFYSQFDLRFDDHYETLSLDFARVKTSSGEIHEVLPSTIQVKTANSALFYNDQKSLTFSLPKLLEGSVIEFQYTRKATKPYVEGHWFHNDMFVVYQRNASTGEYAQDFVHQSDIIITYPNALPVKVTAPNTSEVKHTTSQNGQSTTHQFSYANISELTIEELMPPSWLHRPKVLLTTLDSWDELGNWSYEMFQTALPQDEMDAISDLADSITSEMTTKADKIKAIYAYIQNQTRYVYAHLGRGGFTPHKPSWTLKNGFGDCKDQTALTVALLRAVGIEAFPALYDTDEISVAENVPRLMFDHMITYVPEQPGVKARFIDTSNNQSVFPGLFPRNNLTKALVIGPNSGKFVNVVANDIAIELNIETNYHTIDPEAVKATVTINAVGYYEALIRSIWTQAQEKDKELRKIYGPLFSNATITDMKVVNAENLFAPAKLTFEIEYETQTDLSQGVALGASYQPLLRVFTSFLSPLESENRQHRIFNHGDILINHKTIITDKRVKSASIVSSPTIVKTPYIEAKYSSTDETPFGSVLSIRITPFSLPASKLQEFVRTTKTASDKGYWLIQVNSSKGDSTTAANTESQSIPGVKALIDGGKYEEALTTLLALLEKSEIAEGYYLKGLILGYQSQYDESDKAFDKAIELGYEL